MVTAAQLRAARAYLGWTMDRAAETAGSKRRGGGTWRRTVDL